MLKLRNNLLWALAITMCLLFGLAQLRAQSPELPPGSMREKVTTACTECHESRMILQQRLNRAVWANEVDKMTKWGAVVDPADREGFIDYLSKNFPPNKPPEHMPRAVSAKR